MVDTKTSDLVELTTVVDGDRIPIDDQSDNTITKYITKKNLVTGIVNADIAAGAAIAKTKLAALDIVNADVSATAGLVASKLEAGTKGDVLASNGTNFLKLGVGTNNQVLTADSAEATGVRWATKASGHVMQDEGSSLLTQPFLNFTGAGVTATDNGGSLRTDVTIPGVIGTHHIFIPALSFYPATTNPCSNHTKSELATNDVDIFTLDFAGATTNEIAKVDWIPPENWDAGTVNMKYYWTGAAGAGTVEFETSGVAISNDDPLDAAFGTAVAVTDTFIAADDLHVTPQSGAITIGGTPANADWVQFKLLRDQATDTKAEDAKFIGAVLEYTIDAETSSG